MIFHTRKWPRVNISGKLDADCLIWDKNFYADQKRGGGNHSDLTVGSVAFIIFDSSKWPSVNMSGKLDADCLIQDESSMSTRGRVRSTCNQDGVALTICKIRPQLQRENGGRDLEVTKDGMGLVNGPIRKSGCLTGWSAEWPYGVPAARGNYVILRMVNSSLWRTQGWGRLYNDTWTVSCMWGYMYLRI